MDGWDDVMALPEPQAVKGFRRIDVRLGDDTYNTCNPGVGDADGDGLDEIAVPVIEHERCRIVLYKADGRELWRNDEVRFFNYFYGDMEENKGTHWHAKCRHRHLFTGIFDIDNDGRPEVVCADGPVWVLDARSGALKKMIDLGAHVQSWCPARLAGPEKPPCFVGGMRKRGGTEHAIAAIGSSLDVEWIAPVAGQGITDSMGAGDLDGDGYDEIVFATESSESIHLMDHKGRMRWSRRIKGEIGDDVHIDDVLIDSILPGGEKQILMATGPALLDRDGKIIWTLGAKYDHAQRVLAIGDSAPRRVYFCESYSLTGFLVDHNGREIWSFSKFPCLNAPYTEEPLRGAVVPRLTTMGGVADWFGDGRPVIVQGQTMHIRKPNLIPSLGGMGTFHTTLLGLDGSIVAYLPYEEYCPADGSNLGAMCSTVGRFGPGGRDGVAVITHNASRLYIFTRECVP